jgi:hypothetical protein
MEQSTATLIVGVVGILGTLGGIVIGQRMARSWQRKQWLLDKKIEEYRELLASLTETFTAHVRMQGEGLDSESQRKVADLEAKSLRTIRDRILVAKEISEASILEHWILALRRFERSLNGKQFSADFHAIGDSIVKLAIQTSEKRDLIDDIFESVREDMRSSSGF